MLHQLDAAQCSDAAATSCTFEAGTAAGDQHLPILSAASAPNQAACCSACVRFEGCVAATAKVAGVSSQDYTSLNCRDGTESQHGNDGIHEQMQFDVCTENPALDNLIDDPSTPFDETSVGRYMPGYLKMHCNDDDTVTGGSAHGAAANGGALVAGLAPESIVQKMLTAGVHASTQLSPGIWLGHCVNGTTMTTGWTRPFLRKFLAYQDKVGVCSLDVWTDAGSGPDVGANNTTCPMPCPSTPTCGWALEELRAWRRR